MSQSGLKEPVLLYDANGDPLVLGQATMALSVPVVIASDQSALPVSAASLPLPSGAATEATLALVKAKTDNLDVLLSTRAVTGLTDAQLRATPVPVSGTFWQTTQPISAASLPLPSGAATEATLATLLTTAAFQARINTLGQKAMAASTPVVFASDQSALPVTGTFWQATQPISAVSLPLPTGAATETTLATRATEATLALIKAKTDNLDVALSTRATEATLALIKNTDGIKKIVDPLPAGTNTLGKVDQGVAAAVAGGWPVKVTDGTNLLPTMDVAARAAFVKHTDGTNVMPAGDAVARSIFQQISDGTTGPVTVKPASTAAVAADKPLVVTIHPTSAPITVTNTPAGARTGVSYSLKILGGSTANVLQTMRTTVYAEPASAAQRSISSSSASDTAAGVGARTVKITYYDNSGVGPLTETVTLNGTTAVNTVATNIRFIEKMEVVTAGSSLFNIGTITLFVSTAGAGGTIGTIGVGNIITGVGDNQTFWAHHYVAAGFTAQLSVLVIGIQSGGSGTNGQFFVRSAQPLVANTAEVIVGDSVLAIGTFERAFTFNPNIIGFARLTAYGIPGVNNATMSCAFDWSEVAS